MGHRSRHTDPSIRTLVGEQFGMAVQAVAEGSVLEADWEALVAFVERDGIDSVAQALARQGGFKGPSHEWWRCMLLLCSDLTSEEAARVSRELIAIEEAGSGPAFDVDRYALQVSGVVRWLQQHLQRVLDGTAGREERLRVEKVMRGVKGGREA